ncbi:rna-directed dna polymerase from mobile element jockey-like [Limosa lapponica baueri]|uniref:Rna-directed dna polymerase from mobile element jockey-like n=1 Tax=Limosa lapponica baueri TaxID=1758121 RepID=A0A2I0UT52_LIMLA|nr:rna-directed dna polymerase from mobile element jockey-like [Limosa lapponica baueri]
MAQHLVGGLFFFFCWVLTRPSTSGVTQGSILGPVLFNIFIGDLDDVAECTLTMYTDDTKLGAVPGTLEGCATIQRDISRLEKWADWNLMKFNKGKCNIPHLGRNNPRHLLGADKLESNFTVLLDTEVTISHQYALTARKKYGILGC